ncbi:Ig-like domain-containing protein [Phormidesmis sp. 146-33]
MQVSSIRWGCFTSILGAIVFSSSAQASGLDDYLRSVEAFKAQPNSETNSAIAPEILTSVPLQQTAQVPVATPATGTVRIEFSPASDSRIPADGRSTVTLSGQILDANNQPISEDVTVTLTSSAGKFIGADQGSDRLGFQVIARQGRFSAELQSTLEAKQVRVRAAIDGLHEAKPESKPSPPPFAYPGTLPGHPSQTLEAYATVEFITNLRPSLVSGSINLRIGAAGTNYYKSFADFLSETSFDKGTQVGFDASVFAIGKVGDWLFTGAFNNTRPLNQTCDGTTRLFRDTQFCDQVYPTYGDSSTVDYLTPSIDSVFLKFERTSRVPGAGSDYAMWGDYKTEEFSSASQYFTATSRQLHGFKGNYNFGNFQATLMYGNNLEGFQRDTIAPNGTSGNYFLSRRLVIGGSESVFIETEELNRPGSIVDRIPLSRIRDYEIDYDRGTITFRNPIQTTDFDLFGRTLVRRIVVTYQYEGIGTGGTNLYAGRARYNFSREVQRESWAGVSYLREDRGSRDFELYGADALFSFGKDGQIVAEFARSTNADPFLGDVEGSAYRLEAKTSLFAGVLARGYYRSVDENFSNNATLSFVPGQTRYGGDIAAKIGASTQFRAQVDREINYGIASGFGLGTDLFNPSSNLFCDTPGLARCGQEPFRIGRVDNSLTTISAGFEQKIGESALSFDWVNRTRDDRATNNLDQDSNQLVSRLSVPLTKTLLFRAQNELSLGDDDPLYPSRTTVGLDWKVSPGVTMRLAQQFLSGGQFSSNSITSLDTIIDRKLSDDTSLTGRYSVLNGINGTTGQGAIGLNHRIRLSPGLRINLGYERIFGDLFAYTAAGQQFAQPYAVGQSSSSLGVSSGDSYSVGVEYSDNPDFKASARFERRNSSLGNDTFWSAGAAGKISPALTALVRFQQANAANQLLTGLGDTTNLKVGLAYRDPNSDKLNLLFRYEYRQNPDATPTSLLFGTGSGAKVHLGAIEAIYAPNFRWEFYGKYALRSAQSTLARDLLGTNAISLGQLRTTYRLGYNWDLGGEVRWIGQSVTSFNEFGFLAEVGYYLTPNLRAAVGYSFGEINNDRDFEGSRSKGGFYVTLSFKLNELFNGFGLQRVVPPQQQQESQIKPVATQPDISPQSQMLSPIIQSMIRDQSAEAVVRGVTE